jgi:UDPglucose 6-dehydrogenase
MNIGIIGLGFVGKAVYTGLHRHFGTYYFDRDPDKCNVRDLDELTDKAQVIFLCLPTPMLASGQCDTSIIEGVVKELIGLAEKKGQKLTLCLKSTVPPGTTTRLNSWSFHVNVVFNPEFLTEANYINDFLNQKFIVLGGLSEPATVLDEVFSTTFPVAPIYKCIAEEAELMKLVVNTFLATKVSYANEIYQVCQKLGLKYDNVIGLAKLDKRLGESHWKVPGPMPADDGSGKPAFGYSGSCFPKDTNSLLFIAKSLGIDPKVLQGVWNKNLEVRPERDWENLKGRAVSS